jgi:hypothetical protein
MHESCREDIAASLEKKTINNGFTFCAFQDDASAQYSNTDK